MLSDTEYNEIVAHSYDSNKLMEYLDNKNGSKLVQRISGDRIDEEIVIEDNRFGKYTEYVKEFVTIFQNSLGKYNNNALVTNLRTLVVEEVDSFEKEDALALYDKDNNKVLIKKGYEDEETLKHFLFHELLHMASTYKREPIYLSGFSQTVLPGYGIPSTINEGVTELFTRRYFMRYAEGDENYIYTYEKQMIFLLEAIIGTSKLTEYYFNGDLLGLINELSLYCSKDTANQILFMFNVFGVSAGNHKFGMYLKIKDVLRNIYLKKNLDKFSNNEIDNDGLDFAKLKASLNIRGYNINKRNGYYGFFSVDTNIVYRVTEDMYRILCNYYFSTLEYMSDTNIRDACDNRLIEMVFSLAYLDQIEDLSKVESISIIDYDNREFDINYIMDLDEEIEDEYDDENIEDILAEFSRIRGL